MLFVSLPPVYQEKLLRDIIEHPLTGAVRYNTGVRSPYPAYETLERIVRIAKPLGKPVYVDLKGKQLRIIEWANAPYGPIRLNHDFSVVGPAKVYFRGDDVCDLAEKKGNEIFVDPLPKAPVGHGQSVNIIAAKLTIEGGLLDLDHEYIDAALALGLKQFMLSFVESKDDVRELEDAISKHSKHRIDPADCEIVFKIESKPGVEFVRDTLTRKHFSEKSPYRLMAARDDLMIHIGLLEMPWVLGMIAQRDPRAICASRLLMGLKEGVVSMADLSDLMYMKSLGYQHFMLSDGISQEHGVAALTFWNEYQEG